ncbi:flagellar biosynthetic protein FliO [Thiohalobacter sp. IOR34]|uniref:flagellar biosynthetic protein FliO n=1 Tax=Thiohalobacter sp. IOR34 TaxID=3057176 RepID=UPI0025B21DEF|nr:flagellar biosynthetic protein FliO [Thiohalobacter sp. IOR34]WJW74565.1 flagellar biosynthetic protein FliO [Thiohalobacter sp. IOR34]
MRIRISGLALLFLPLQTLVAADETAPLVEPVAAGSLLQMLLGLALVVLLIVGFGWLFKRLTRMQSVANGSLRVLGGLSMGTRERVVLIQVGDTQLLLGVAPGRVQTLHVLDRALPLDAAPGKEMAGFAASLKAALGKDGTP